MVYDEIWWLCKKYLDKLLYVVVIDMCVLGGYYIVFVVDKIFVDKVSIVGLIGVLMDGFGFIGLMGKFGVEWCLYMLGENKGFYDLFLLEMLKMDVYV